MSIENLAPYSPTTVYGQLTSPFTPKQITINAHTPYDKVDDTNIESEAFSRAFFEEKPIARNVYGNVYNYESYYTDDFPPKVSSQDNESQNTQNISSELSNFSVSSFSSNKILKGSLSSGYSVNESLVIRNAYNAYQRSALITKNAPEVLNTCSYRVF